MDDANGSETGDRSREAGELIPRPPDDSDLANLCRHLNEIGADYLVVGGFGVIHTGYAPTIRRSLA